MEKRDLNSPEIRLNPKPIFEATQEGKKWVLKGYGAVFGTRYPMYHPSVGEYFETVDPGAFRNADLSDVVILWNHSKLELLGRTSSGTARVFVDEKGLGYSCILPKGPRGEDMAQAVIRGDVSQSSWSFPADSKTFKWSRDERGNALCTIVNISMVDDCSPVTRPANPAAPVSIEGFDGTRGANTAYEKDLLLEAEQAMFKPKQLSAGNQQKSLQATLDETDRILNLIELEREYNKPVEAIQKRTNDMIAARLDKTLLEMENFRIEQERRMNRKRF